MWEHRSAGAQVGPFLPPLVLSIALAVASPAQEGLAVDVRARALYPGEVVRLEITARVPVEALTVRAFDQEPPVVPIGDGLWRALVGIDLDVPPGAHRVTIAADRREAADARGGVVRGGLVLEKVLQVEPKEFPTRRLTVAPKYVNPPATVQARIERERARLTGIYEHVTDGFAWDEPFMAPIPGAVISGFGRRSVFNDQPRAPHSGADFSSPAGTPVKAPNAGRIALADDLYYTGQTVVIDHGAGLISVLAHLSRIDVEPEAEVQRGAIVGAVGATGRVTGPHLHWTVRLNGARVDPLSLIAVLEDLP